MISEDRYREGIPFQRWRAPYFAFSGSCEETPSARLPRTSAAGSCQGTSSLVPLTHWTCRRF